MIGKADIEKLAELARIDLSEEEKTSFVKDIDSILAYVGQIQEVAGTTTGTDTMSQVNVLREDENPHQSGIFTDAIIKGAPEKEGRYIKVKKILTN
jgi:aspartyl-tRNA(Asn)/glutamyl-tRNA(Gln) amidotransferase subunit C